MIRESRFHRRGDPEGLVNPAEVVVHEVKRHGVGQVFYFLGERIGKPREPAHAHAHGQVLALNVGRGNVPLSRVACDLLAARAAALASAIPPLRALAFRLAVQFD